MPVSLNNLLVIGISSRALFDLEMEEAIFRTQGLDAYRAHQLNNENAILKLGAGFALVCALLKLNVLTHNQRFVEVVIMSRNDPATSLRMFNTIKHYGLDIQRAALAGGASLAPYLRAFQVSLFLSAFESDVRDALKDGFAAGLIVGVPKDPMEPIDPIRFAFDADAVLFSHLAGGSNEHVRLGQKCDGRAAHAAAS